MFIDFCKDGQVVHLEKKRSRSALYLSLLLPELRTSNMAIRELLPKLKALHYLKDRNRSADSVAVMVNYFVHGNKITNS